MSEDHNNKNNQRGTQEAGRQPIFLLPLPVTALAGLMVAIHLARSAILNDQGVEQLLAWFAFIPYRLVVADQVDGGFWPLLWTPATHAFLHAGWEHLLLNLAWLVIFATPVARRYGGWAMLVIFLASAMAGAALFAATTLPGLAVLIGASGGISGLTGAAVRFMFQPLVVAKDPVTGETHILGRHLASLKELARDVRARAFIIIWAVLNAAVPLLPLVVGGEIGIAWQAHLAGFFTGLLLAPLFERRHLAAPLPPTEPPAEDDHAL